MPDTPPTPRLGLILNPAQSLVVKVARIAARLWVLFGLFIIGANWLSGHTPVLPSALYVQIALVAGLVVGAILLLLSGAFYARVWATGRNLLTWFKTRPQRRQEFRSTATETASDAVDPARFADADDAPDTGARDFSRAFRQHLTPSDDRQESKRAKLEAIIADPAATNSERAEAARKLRTLPAPPKQITHKR